MGSWICWEAAAGILRGQGLTEDEHLMLDMTSIYYEGKKFHELLEEVSNRPFAAVKQNGVVRYIGYHKV